MNGPLCDVTILDCAMGTALGRRGVRLDPPLWSANGLIEHPDIVVALHCAYLRAGADLITANTFRTHPWTINHAGRDDARALTQRAVELARSARDKTQPNADVLGSVAPLEDCYSPHAAPAPEVCADAHSAMIETLIESGVDGVLIETMGTVREATAAARAAADLVPGRWMLSMCMQRDGPAGVLLSGEPVGDVISAIADVIDTAEAVGVNCVAAPDTTRQVAALRALVPASVQIMAYANTGRMSVPADDPAMSTVWIDTDATDAERYADYALEWRTAGATIIGGCCGTTPEAIAAIFNRLQPGSA